MTTSNPGAVVTLAAHDSSPTVPPRYAVWKCLVASAIWFALTSSLRPLAIPDEGRYVGVAWEILKGRDWSVPTLDGMPFFHKPPLFYWLTAASMDVWGPHVFAARFAPWLGAVATTTTVFAFATRWLGLAEARLWVVVLATMPLFFGGAQYANLDMLVASCIAIAVLLFAHSTLARERGQPHQAVLALAFATAALGMLSKGMIGAVLPAATVIVWGLATRRLGRVATLLAWAPGWCAFAAIAAPWFILMQRRFPEFFHYFFVVQQVDRFQSGGFNNPQPFWFYPAVLLLLTLPWSPWLLARLARDEGRSDRRSPPVAQDVSRLMLAWLAVVTLFFSLPSSKLVGYILPALVPLAYLVAAGIPRRWSRWARATAVVAAVVCVGGVLIAHRGQPKSRAALAEAMRKERRPDEPVIYLRNYYYDIEFYAGLVAPPIVVDAWDPSEVAKDSWRRELRDAEGFSRGAAPPHLLMDTDLDPVLCRTTGAWVVGAWPASAGPAWLRALAPSFHDADTGLWHVEASRPAVRSALACAH